MKSIIIAAGLLAVGATAVSAQSIRWSRDHHPYHERHHSLCQAKAIDLNRYERRATSDGRLSRSERAIMRDLERDLDRTCGRYRWRG